MLCPQGATLPPVVRLIMLWVVFSSTTALKMGMTCLRNRTAAWAILLCSTTPLHSLRGADSRPNILWIIAEDMGPDLSCYGAAQVWTPVLDDLAHRGMRFTRAFTVTPVCSTSRSSFMTGMYAMSISAHNHRSHRDDHFPLPEGVRVLTDWFRAAGYTTANIRRLTCDSRRSAFHRGTGKTDWNFTYPADRKPFDLDAWDELKHNQPFLAQINFSETHRGNTWNHAHEHIARRADPALVSIPPYYPDHPVTREVMAQYLNAVMAVDKKVGFILDRLRQDGLNNNTLVVFTSDHGRAMPRAKQWPYDSGLHVPLIVCWPAGNSELPPPAGWQSDAVSDRLVASIDLSATLLALAGIKKPPAMQGRVFLGATEEPPRHYLFGGRDRGDETVFHIRTVRDQRYRYIRNRYPQRPFLQLNRYKESEYPIIGLLRNLQAAGRLNGPPAALLAPTRPAEELYDLETDPYEIHNVAQSPTYQAVRARLAEALDRWIEQIDDQGRFPEPDDVVAWWETRSQQIYDQHLQSRAADWFLDHPALGPGAGRSPKP